jgi:predicted nucleic acid-binding protein
MARVSSFDSQLDTCVLLPITLCDTLLRFAEAGFYRPHWSQETLDELVRNLVLKLGLSAEVARRRVVSMTTAFPEALVEGYQLLVPAMPNDAKDRHVLAAAIRSGSQVIVTSNVRHFPSEALSQFDIEAQRPDLFLLHQLNLDARGSVGVLRGQAAEKTRPPQRTADVLDRLETNAPIFVQAIRLLEGIEAPVELRLPVELPHLEAELAAVREHPSRPV